jgi:hypothetical protein
LIDLLQGIGQLLNLAPTQGFVVSENLMETILSYEGKLEMVVTAKALYVTSFFAVDRVFVTPLIVNATHGSSVNTNGLIFDIHDVGGKRTFDKEITFA